MLVFCFLTYHDIQPISYWNHFFQNIDHNEFKVIIHPKLQINSSIYSFPIQCVQKRILTISKSHISIVNATLQLLREAYNVTENENDTHFIFCSQHCIPLYPFTFYKNFLQTCSKSIVSYIPRNKKERYFQLHPNCKKFISYSQFGKQQPNMILSKVDVKLLIDNDLTIYFKNIECPDEHYFINILRFILKKDIIISQTHFCNFDLTKTQALTFKNINESMLKKIKSLGFLFMRKVT